MNEYGQLVEEVVTIIGPVRRRTVREEWHNSNLEPTAIVPCFSHLTLTDKPGRRVLLELGLLRGRIDRYPPEEG